MRYFIILLFSFILTPVLAQDTAKDILDKSANKIKAYSAVEIDFCLTMENKEENIREEHKGKAYMKGNLYKLEVMDVINYYDGKNIFTYIPEAQEVNIKNPSDEEEEMLNPTKIFNIHNIGFKQKLLSNTNGTAYIELYPNNLEKNFIKIGIWVKTSDSSIQKVESFGKDGNNLIITIKHLKQANPIPQNTFFTFDATQYPDVEIIDLR
ncbi:LolA family protein [Odoribacter lunatus]|uniref:LolA family protein n=1 Tax=Odoribacter lunatus TaxID=2941335 RepID=UPI00203C0CA0|nr:outer membrane lipoprotein carrier protein LolA [Odoribacter lunatus]